MASPQDSKNDSVVSISIKRAPFLKRAMEWSYGVAEEAFFTAVSHGKMPENRFVIFAQGRSGTTLLQSLLDSHPQIRCNDELLQRPRLAPLRFIDNVARVARDSHHGFHLKIDHLLWIQGIKDVGKFLDSLEERNIRIIYLWRENVLNTCFSNYYARAIGIWHFRTTENERPEVKVHIEPKEMIRLLNEATGFLKFEREVLSGRDYCEINYERDLASSTGREPAMVRLQDFIGVDHFPMVSKLHKSVKKPISELIENYDELLAVIEASPYAHLLPKTAKA